MVEFHQSLAQPSSYTPVPLRSHFGSHAAIWLYASTDLNSFTSSMYRSAVLVLMSSLKNANPTETSAYLVKYYREAQDCIKHVSHMELVYGAYIIAIYSIIRGETIQIAIKRSLQFCKSVAELARVRKSIDEWIELLWRETLSSLYYVHRDTVLFSYHNAMSSDGVEQWDELLGSSYDLLASENDIAKLPLSMTTKKMCHKINSLSVYMHLYLDQFLKRALVDETAKETKLAKERLCSIVDRLLVLIPRLSNISDYIYDAYNMETNSNSLNNSPNTFLHFPPVHPRGLRLATDPDTRDISLALVYAFARLLKSMLQPTFGEEEGLLSDPYLSAIAICRICANIPLGWARETLLLKRSVFWAGLILTESTLPSGQIQCISTF